MVFIKNKIRLLIIIIMMLFLYSCSGKKSDEDTLKIGLSWSDFTIERWSIENDIITDICLSKGYEVISQVANHDARLQNDQIENMINQGVDVLIICCEDGDAVVTAVARAVDAGIPVISYSRLIKSPLISAYITFDGWAVGRAQAKAMLDNAVGNRFVLLGGSKTDNNALLYRDGQLQILDPYIKSGEITIVSDRWVENWDTQKALSVMESILTSTGNNIDAVVASNDSTAFGVIQALEAQGLAGIIPVSGQDATLAGCKSIVENKLTMTVFKDLRALGPLSIELAEILVSDLPLNASTVPKGSNYSLASISGDPRMNGDIFCVLLPIVPVTKENIYDVVIKSGFQDFDAVYQDVPVAFRPAPLSTDEIEWEDGQ